MNGDATVITDRHVKGSILADEKSTVITDEPITRIRDRDESTVTVSPQPSKSPYFLPQEEIEELAGRMEDASSPTHALEAYREESSSLTSVEDRETPGLEERSMQLGESPYLLPQSELEALAERIENVPVPSPEGSIEPSGQPVQEQPEPEIQAPPTETETQTLIQAEATQPETHEDTPETQATTTQETPIETEPQTEQETQATPDQQPDTQPQDTTETTPQTPTEAQPPTQQPTTTQPPDTQQEQETQQTETPTQEQPQAEPQEEVQTETLTSPQETIPTETQAQETQEEIETVGIEEHARQIPESDVEEEEREPDLEEEFIEEATVESKNEDAGPRIEQTITKVVEEPDKKEGEKRGDHDQLVLWSGEGEVSKDERIERLKKALERGLITKRAYEMTIRKINNEMSQNNAAPEKDVEQLIQEEELLHFERVRDSLVEDMNALDNLFEQGIIDKDHYEKSKRNLEKKLRDVENLISDLEKSEKIRELEERIEEDVSKILGSEEFVRVQREKAKKLRDLKKLYEDGVIDKEVFLQKKAEIEASMNDVELLIREIDSVIEKYSEKLKQEVEELEKKLEEKPEPSGEKTEEQGKEREERKSLFGIFSRKKTGEESEREDTRELKEIERIKRTMEGRDAVKEIEYQVKSAVKRVLGIEREVTYDELVDIIGKTEDLDPELKADLINYFKRLSRALYAGSLNQASVTGIYEESVDLVKRVYKEGKKKTKHDKKAGGFSLFFRIVSKPREEKKETPQETEREERERSKEEMTEREEKSEQEKESRENSVVSSIASRIAEIKKQIW